jgi:hypothetical protein
MAKNGNHKNAAVVRDEEKIVTAIPKGAKAGTGQGMDVAATDKLVPIITIAKTNSPQVDSSSDKYVAGAVPGSIIILDDVIDGNSGIYFQECVFQKVWIEWVDRDKGGGFVTRYANVVTKRGQDRPDCPDPIEPEGYGFRNKRTNNLITNHHNHYGFILRRGESQPYMISFKGSGISESRKWNTMFSSVDGQGNKTDRAQFQWLLRTKKKMNAKGSWHDIYVERKGMVTKGGEYDEAQVDMGRALADSFADQKLIGDFASMTEASEDDDGRL